MNKLIGYQVESNDGLHNIHPDMDASFCVYSLEQSNEMIGDDNNDWIIVPIYKGDIEEPTIMF